jgi:UDP-2,4-diacetamido-2,4,6-trideoxy-beta-L-altropyranose hydrolase
MKRPSAIFRCDASHEIGSGHVMRCLTIANYLRDCGWECAFSACDGATQAVPFLLQSGFEIIGPEVRRSSEIVFIDNYAMSYEQDHSYRGHAGKIIVLDDLADRTHDCDVLLDQTFSRNSDDYKSLVPESSVILTGSDYALLRPQFLEYRDSSLKRRAAFSGKIERVLISLGGTDPHNVMSIVLDGLQGSTISIDAVIGAGCPHLPQVMQKISAMADQGVKIQAHQNVSNMAELMGRADIAIGAGGTTSWERCCLGLPTVMIELAENQHDIATALSKDGCVLNLGWYADITPDMIRQTVIGLQNDPARVVKMTKHALAICDGRGMDRLAPFCIAQDDGIQLVLMSESDMRILHDWQSFPATRKYARNPEVPSWDDHVLWFKRTLNNPDSFLYKITKDGIAAGMLRLDRRASDTREFEVSILIAPDFYGRGIASVALDFIRKLDPVATFMAEVHVENEASRRLFLKAGFTPVNETWFEQKRAV